MKIFYYKNDSLEKDYFINNIFSQIKMKNINYIYFSDIEKIKESQNDDKNILIVNTSLNIESINNFVSLIKPHVIFLLGNKFISHSDILLLSNKTKLFFVSLNYNLSKNILQIPSEYFNNHLLQKYIFDHEISSIFGRKNNVLFISQLKENKHDLIKLFASKIYAFCVESEDKLNSYEKYCFNCESKIVLIENYTELNKIYEGIIAGAVPLIVCNEKEFNNMFYFNNDSPYLIRANNWEEAADLSNSLLNNMNSLEQIQKKNIDWIKRQIKNSQDLIIKILFNNEEFIFPRINNQTIENKIFNNNDYNTNGELIFFNKISKKIKKIFYIGCGTKKIFENFDGEVHYFEPINQFLQIFKNENKKNYLNNFALGEKNEKLLYYPGFQSFYDRSLTLNTNTLFPSIDLTPILFNIKKASDYVIRKKINKIDLLKISTEGFEFNVLKGFEKYIINVDIIQFEYGGCFIDSKIKLIDIVNYLEDFDFYKFSYLTPNGTILIQDFNDHYQYCNIVCLNRNSSYQYF